uniref:Uncharacterized protein n=1 Tax=Chlamydomonas euryale TaxID=1486919 RepID=A0A7R9YVI5_9CHLO
MSTECKAGSKAALAYESMYGQALELLPDGSDVDIKQIKKIVHNTTGTNRSHELRSKTVKVPSGDELCSSFEEALERYWEPCKTQLHQDLPSIQRYRSVLKTCAAAGDGKRSADDMLGNWRSPQQLPSNENVPPLALASVQDQVPVHAQESTTYEVFTPSTTAVQPRPQPLLGMPEPVQAASDARRFAQGPRQA